MIVVFHTNAGHVTLDDAAYNASRNIATDNSYKKLVADLIDLGVKVELCGATAKVNGWGTPIFCPTSRLIWMPWLVRYSSFSMVSSRSRSDLDPVTTIGPRRPSCFNCHSDSILLLPMF
ncbi:hypothetical protein J2X72_004350 [Phyllobacterium sp. 1468]|nr:hypothetical protein [Phyllobacterium sp. 1468]